MTNFIQKMFGYQSASDKLCEATALVAESLTQAAYPERIQDVYTYIKYNESSLALEILCENLYEFSCPVSQKAYNLLAEAGAEMKIDSEYWESLKPQIVD